MAFAMIASWAMPVLRWRPTKSVASTPSDAVDRPEAVRRRLLMNELPDGGIIPLCRRVHEASFPCATKSARATESWPARRG
jgi:hypothetical protein